MPNQFILIGGEDRPLNFGRNFWNEVETLSGKTTGVILKNWGDEVYSFKMQTIITYSALKWGLYNQKNGNEPQPDFTQFKVATWIDENSIEIMNKIWAEMTASLPKKNEKEAHPM